MNKFKIGDRVRVKTDENGDPLNRESRMRGISGTVVEGDNEHMKSRGWVFVQWPISDHPWTERPENLILNSR